MGDVTHENALRQLRDVAHPANPDKVVVDGLLMVLPVLTLDGCALGTYSFESCTMLCGLGLPCRDDTDFLLGREALRQRSDCVRPVDFPGGRPGVGKLPHLSCGADRHTCNLHNMCGFRFIVRATA
jgi:hypothetical protein